MTAALIATSNPKTQTESSRFTPTSSVRGADSALGRPSHPSWTSVLFDEREHLEHRQVHRDDDHADHHADEDHHDRLHDRRQGLDRRVDLVLVEVRDLAEHLLELARLL